MIELGGRDGCQVRMMGMGMGRWEECVVGMEGMGWDGGDGRDEG